MMVTVFACAFVMPSSAESNDNMIVWNGAPAYSRLLYRPDTGLFVAGTKYLYMFDMEMTDIAEADEGYYWRVFYCNNDSTFTRIPHEDFEITKTPRSNGFHYDVKFTIPDDCRDYNNILLKFGDTGANGYEQTMKVGNLALWSLDDKGKKSEEIKIDVPEKLEDIYESTNTNEKNNGSHGKWVAPKDYVKNITIQPQNGYFTPADEYEQIIDGDMIVWSGAPEYSRMLYRPDTGLFVAGTTYIYSFDMEMTDVAASDEGRFWGVFYCNNESTFTRIPHADLEITKTPLENGFHYDVKFTVPDDCRDYNNILLKFGDINANGYTQTMKLANLDLWSLDAGGKKDAQIELGIPATIEDIYQSSDSNEKWNGSHGKWVAPVNYVVNITIQPQRGYFYPEESGGIGGAEVEPAVKLQNGEGTFAQFVTAKSNTDYAFSFKFKSENGTQANPYIEAFSSTGSLGKLNITYSKKDFDGYYNYYGEFTTPDGLGDTNNLRIGISSDPTDTVYATDFELYELDDRSEKVGENLINDPEFENTFSIDAYDGNPSDKWAFEGTGTAVMAEEVFAIPAPQVLLFAGGKNAGYIGYEAKLNPSGNYNVSLNLKYGSEGYAGDTGIEFEYHNGSAWVSMEATGGKVKGEYKYAYTLTLPADARTGKDNFRVSAKVGSAPVTGYISNLTIYSQGDS
ncbi:MAG: hypothetical protein J6T73_05565, partial [Clostridia bacterium]|nr:hypothetical protein [Clostridia bacterium]